MRQARGIIQRVTAFPSLRKLGRKGRCINFWVYFSVETKSPGVKRKTVIRLMQIPLARARPRSGPMPKRITDNARKPIITVTALEKTAVPA